MKYLLDVNVLIAAAWQPHQHFDRVGSWIQGKSLATCPLTEMGFLRILTNPKVFGVAMSDARAVLQGFTKENRTAFIPADLPVLQSERQTSGEITDIYLAELAARHGMKFATLDGSISHPAAVSI